MWRKKPSVNSNVRAIVCSKASCGICSTPNCGKCAKKANFGVQTPIANMGCIEDTVTEIATEIATEVVNNFVTDNPSIADDGSFATDGSGNPITSNAARTVGSSTYPANLGEYSVIAGDGSRAPSANSVVQGRSAQGLSEGNLVEGAFASCGTGSTGGIALGVGAFVGNNCLQCSAVGLGSRVFDNCRYSAAIGADATIFQNCVGSTTMGVSSFVVASGADSSVYGFNSKSWMAKGTVMGANCVAGDATFPLSTERGLVAGEGSTALHSRSSVFGWDIASERDNGIFFSDQNDDQVVVGDSTNSPYIVNASWQNWASSRELTRNVAKKVFDVPITLLRTDVDVNWLFPFYSIYLTNVDINKNSHFSNGGRFTRRGTITYSSSSSTHSIVDEILTFTLAVDDINASDRFEYQCEYLPNGSNLGFANADDVSCTWSCNAPLLGFRSNDPLLFAPPIFVQRVLAKPGIQPTIEFDVLWGDDYAGPFEIQLHLIYNYVTY